MAQRFEDSLLRWHCSHFWVRITIFKVVKSNRKLPAASHYSTHSVHWPPGQRIPSCCSGWSRTSRLHTWSTSPRPFDTTSGSLPSVYDQHLNNIETTIYPRSMPLCSSTQPLKTDWVAGDPRELTYELTRFRCIADAFRLACMQQTHCGMDASIILHTQMITRAGNMVYV